jgi:DNA-binding NtrC family response regulator
LEDKSFRSDLYYRLTRFTLTVPPLKDHKEHIPELIQTTIRTYCQTNRISEPAISPQLMDKLSGYHWPGNIRELKLVIQRALIHYETHGFFNESCFEPPFRKKNNQDMMDLYTFLCDEIITRRTDLKKIEKDIINMLIDKFDGDIITASKETGIFRDKFYRNRSSR